MRGYTEPARWRATVQLLIALGLAAMALAACADGEAPQAVPTRTLLPPTHTPTPAPPALTPTPTDLPGPSALAATATEMAPPVAPPVVQTLIARMTDNLVTQQGVDPADVRLLSIEAFTWHDATLGCATRGRDTEGSAEAIPGYRLVFSADNRAYVYHADETGTFFLCRDRTWLGLEGEPVVIDPIAQSMIELCLPDAAQRLAVPESDVRLASVLTVTWPDSSVGCPKPGAEYDDRPTQGYRLVIRAGDQALIYHTSIRHCVRCAPEEEILPGLLRQALPSPTPAP